MNPTLDILNCRITSEFGPRTAPTAGATTQHNAVDYVTEEGKIFSPVSGTILREGFDNKAGNYVEIQSYSDRTIHLMGHMKERCLKDKGNSVSVGEVLGFMGNTGISTGAHVHWSIKDDVGTPIPNHTWLELSKPLKKGDILLVKAELLNNKFVYSAILNQKNTTDDQEMDAEMTFTEEEVNSVYESEDGFLV